MEILPSGIESTFMINHFGPSFLTMSLLELLLKTKDSRVVFVSSDAHCSVDIFPLETLFDPSPSGYDTGLRYGETKLANILFAQELARRNKSLLVTTCHPGTVRTDFNGENFNNWLKKYSPLAVCNK